MARGRRAVKAAAPVAATTNGSDAEAFAPASSSEEEWSRDPKPKRRKSYNRKAAKRHSSDDGEETSKRPALDGILDTLSVDTLAHVLAALEPKDLLSIARASKAAHALVMDAENGPRFFAESFKPFLEAAENKLPQPPKDLSLAQYAALVWPVRDCTACGSGDKYNVQTRWLWRKTFCFACNSELFVHEQPANGHIYAPGKSIKEAKLDGDKRALLITRSETVKSPHGYGGSAQLYLVAEVEAALVTLTEVDQLAPTEASEKMAALAKDGKAQVKAARLITERIDAWRKAERDAERTRNEAEHTRKQQVRKQARKVFLNEIERRLDDLEYEPADYAGMRDGFPNHYPYRYGIQSSETNLVGHAFHFGKVVLDTTYEPAPVLTDERWAKLEPLIVEHIQAVKREKELKEDANAQASLEKKRARATGLLKDEIEDLVAMSALDAGLIPPTSTIRQLFRGQIEQLVEDDELEIDKDILAASVSEWRSTVIGDLAALVRTADDEDATDLELLARPSAQFKCSRCSDRGTLVYPAVASHDCINYAANRETGDEETDGGVPLPSNVIVSAGAEEVAYAVVDAVGLDAGTTLDELIERGAVFILAADDEDMEEADDDDELYEEENVDEAISLLKNKAHTFLEIVRQLMRTGPSLACDVKMAWPVERTPLGKDEAEPEPGSRHLWTCGSCATFKPVSHEAIAWEHALDTHNVVAVPTSKQIVGLAVPISAEA